MSKYTEALINYLEEHGSITATEANKELDMKNLPDYIKYAQRRGYDITEAYEKTSRITFNPNKRDARLTTRYFLNDVCEVV